jgi:uncharacterized Zn finger protein
MAKTEFGKTWWSQRFIRAIETLTDDARLSRGRSYARGSKIKSFTIKNNQVIAQIRGSINPYFGVTKEPTYITTVEFEPFSDAQWHAAIAFIASKAGFLAKLMLNEIPETIEEPFKTLDIHLLPQDDDDLNAQCSCPDSSNPCKHIAGLYYRLAEELDRDPYLLFELRGMPRQKFQTALESTPLGKSLAQELKGKIITPEPIESYYSRPLLIAPMEETRPLDIHHFWMGQKRLPKDLASPENTSVNRSVSGILVKKQGDAPAFWRSQTSFLAVMDEFYDRVKTRNSDVF